MNHISVGRIGEDIACAYLTETGYKLVDRNYPFKWGEIDIIAINTDKILTFVEVKTIKINDFAGVDNSANMGITPEDNLTKSKFIKLQKCAEYYANTHSRYLYKDKGFQIDLVAVLLNNRGESKVTHYENIER